MESGTKFVSQLLSCANCGKRGLRSAYASRKATKTAPGAVSDSGNSNLDAHLCSPECDQEYLELHPFQSEERSLKKCLFSNSKILESLELPSMNFGTLNSFVGAILGLLGSQKVKKTLMEMFATPKFKNIPSEVTLDDSSPENQFDCLLVVCHNLLDCLSSQKSIFRTINRVDSFNSLRKIVDFLQLMYSEHRSKSVEQNGDTAYPYNNYFEYFVAEMSKCLESLSREQCVIDNSEDGVVGQKEGSSMLQEPTEGVMQTDLDEKTEVSGDEPATSNLEANPMISPLSFLRIDLENTPLQEKSVILDMGGKLYDIRYLIGDAHFDMADLRQLRMFVKKELNFKLPFMFVWVSTQVQCASKCDSRFKNARYCSKCNQPIPLNPYNARVLPDDCKLIELDEMSQIKNLTFGAGNPWGQQQYQSLSSGYLTVARVFSNFTDDSSKSFSNYEHLRKESRDIKTLNLMMMERSVSDGQNQTISYYFYARTQKSESSQTVKQPSPQELAFQFCHIGFDGSPICSNPLSAQVHHKQDRVLGRIHFVNKEVRLFQFHQQSNHPVSNPRVRPIAKTLNYFVEEVVGCWRQNALRVSPHLVPVSPPDVLVVKFGSKSWSRILMKLFCKTLTLRDQSTICEEPEQSGVQYQPCAYGIGKSETNIENEEVWIPTQTDSGVSSLFSTVQGNLSVDSSVLGSQPFDQILFERKQVRD